MKDLLRFAAPALLLVLGAACSAPADGGSAAAPTSVAASADAPPAPVAIEVATFDLAHPAPDAARLLADVAWLADDAREGRRAGTDGERVAADWIAARLEALNLTPAGDDGWFQRFEVPLPVRDGGGSYLEWIDLSEGEIASGTVDAVPLFCSAGATARGRLVYAGYGIVEEERGWNDYAEIDVQGAVAVVLRGAPERDAGEGGEEPAAGSASPHGGPASSGWGSSATIFHKVMEAKRRGAVGVVLLPRTPEEELLRFDAGRQAESGIPAVTITWETFEGLRDSDELVIHADVVRERGTATNVLGRIVGEDSSRAVVLGAHYDHLGHGGLGSLEREVSGLVHNGADDNASGTAVVLEVARCLVEGRTPPCDVVFALWSGEELGLLGSEHWAQEPTLPLERVLFNLNLDMVGRAGDGKLQVLGAGTAEPFVDWLHAGQAEAGMSLAISSSGRGIGGSDHQTFLKREIPALHFFSGVHTDYHKPTDDTERFEAEGAERVAALSLELVAAAMQRVVDGEVLAYVAPPEDPDAGQARGGFRTRFGSVPEYSFEGPGVLLAGTSAGGPAERGGLLKGDVVRKIGDVDVESIHDLMFALNAHKPGDVVLVRYVREGEDREVRLTLDSPDLE